MDLKYLILNNMWIMEHMNSNYQEWHNTTSNNMIERMHSGLQYEESLSSSEKNIDERFEKELNPLWTIM